MSEKGKRKTMLLGMALLLLFFYILIIMYVFFIVIKIYFFPTFAAALLFEGIGVCALAAIILMACGSWRIKASYLISLSVFTVLYIFFLNLLNMLGGVFIQPVFFILLHMGLLFVYCLVSVPMYTMIFMCRRAPDKSET